MCELLAMSSSRSSQLNFSLQTLSGHTKNGARDGWGIGFYQGRDVALFREPVAASDSALVEFLQTQGPGTTLAISHIRHATIGTKTLANTQPMAREMAGRVHVFAHNGNLPCIAQARRFTLGRYQPVGDTDSEHAFCVLLDRMHSLWDATAPPTLAARLAVVTAFAAELRELGPANFLYADSEILFAHGDRRYQAADGSTSAPGLVYLTCRCSDPAEPLQGVSITPGFQDLVLIASVALNEERWHPFAEGQIISVSMGRIL